MSDFFDFGIPLDPDQSDGGVHYTLGCEWESDLPGTCVGNRWRCSNIGPGTQCKMVLFTAADHLKVAESALFTAAGAEENEVLFVTPYEIEAGIRYVSAVVTNRYAYTTGPSGFPFTSEEGHLLAPADVNGRFEISAGGSGQEVWPGQIGASNYHIGPLVDVVVAVMDTHGWIPRLNSRCVYLQQKTFDGNDTYVKRIPVKITDFAADGFPILTNKQSGVVFGDSTNGIQPRSAPDADEVGVYVSY